MLFYAGRHLEITTRTHCTPCCGFGRSSSSRAWACAGCLLLALVRFPGLGKSHRHGWRRHLVPSSWHWGMQTSGDRRTQACPDPNVSRLELLRTNPCVRPPACTAGLGSRRPAPRQGFRRSRANGSRRRQISGKALRLCEWSLCWRLVLAVRDWRNDYGRRSVRRSSSEFEGQQANGAAGGFGSYHGARRRKQARA